jgi:ADP-ribose pyrophosphatase YjhB (NUDIX family)
VLLVDDAGRLLLFSVGGEADEPTRWFAVGGGVEPGETYEQAAFEEFEKASVTGHRWWTAEELATTTDVLRPAGLPQLLAQLLSDGPPDQPIAVDG